jgi:hypothetical protein
MRFRRSMEYHYRSIWRDPDSTVGRYMLAALKVVSAI